MLLPRRYSNIESVKRIRQAKITGKPQTLDDLVRNGVVIVGSPNTVREKLAEYQDLAGFNTSLTKTQFGTLPDDMTRANMTAIACRRERGRPRRSRSAASLRGGRRPTKQSRPAGTGASDERDCFAEFILGLAEGKTRGLAMTEGERPCHS